MSCQHNKISHPIAIAATAASRGKRGKKTPHWVVWGSEDLMKNTVNEPRTIETQVLFNRKLNDCRIATPTRKRSSHPLRCVVSQRVQAALRGTRCPTRSIPAMALSYSPPRTAAMMVSMIASSWSGLLYEMAALPLSSSNTRLPYRTTK